MVHVGLKVSTSCIVMPLPQVMALSLQPYGCRVLQKALQHADDDLFQVFCSKMQSR